jgi:hypothetical protein
VGAPSFEEVLVGAPQTGGGERGRRCEHSVGCGVFVFNTDGAGSHRRREGMSEPLIDPGAVGNGDDRGLTSPTFVRPPGRTSAGHP